jgi:indolepyruvate ferredoxin oxidoreductase alpha subunit
MTVFILDNATVAMTGGQPTFLSGEKLTRVIEGMGVAKEHIQTILPLPKNHAENVRIIKQELAYTGLSVIIAARECVQQARKKKGRRT